METEYTPLFLALLAGLLYACSAVLCKKGLELGSGTIRSLVFSNFIMSACFLPYPFLSDQPFLPNDLIVGACLGFLFFAAQFFCFLALRNGEASLITPIMGSKPIFVALFLSVHGLSTEQVTWEIWLASALAAIAIALLCWPSKDTKTSRLALVLALATAATFGLLDSLVPYFTHQSSPLNVLFFVFGSVGIYSLCLIPYTEGKFIPRRKNADSWMWTSAIFMGGQAVLMSIAIGLYQVPTAANVFYACRGLWAVILVAWLGKKMQIDESDSSPSTITRRGIGACILIFGVWLTSDT
ncbi:MAG: EamA family transporter [Verrucomicrobiota bacterium]|nr:EamA family transporter [Verrucomicrobiota bacterium]